MSTPRTRFDSSFASSLLIAFSANQNLSIHRDAVSKCKIVALYCYIFLMGIAPKKPVKLGQKFWVRWLEDTCSAEVYKFQGKVDKIGRERVHLSEIRLLSFSCFVTFLILCKHCLKSTFLKDVRHCFEHFISLISQIIPVYFILIICILQQHLLLPSSLLWLIIRSVWRYQSALIWAFFLNENIFYLFFDHFKYHAFNICAFSCSTTENQALIFCFCSFRNGEYIFFWHLSRIIEALPFFLDIC